MVKRVSSFSIADVSYGLVLGLVVALPLLILPFTDQPIVDTKVYVSILVGILLTGLFGLNSLRTKSFRFVASPVSIPLALFGLSIIASTFFSSNYPVEHLLGAGGVYTASLLIAGLGSSLMSKRFTVGHLLWTMVIASVLLTFSTLIQVFGGGLSTFYNQFVTTDFPNTSIFNLAGSPLIAAQFIAVTLAGFSAWVVSSKRMTPLSLGVIGVLVLGLGIHVWNLLPGKEATPVLLPMTANWSVASDLLKSPKAALIGVGPESFANAYNQVKPLWMNSTSLWNVQFTQGSNMPLTLVVTTGLLGLLAWVILVFKLVKETKHVPLAVLPLHFMVLLMLGLQLVVPPNTITFTVFGIVLAFWIGLQQDRFGELEIHGVNLKQLKRKSFAPASTTEGKAVIIGTSVAVLLFSAVCIYGLGRAYAAQIVLNQAGKAAQANEIVNVYTAQQRAIKLNPYIDSYRRNYALTNLGIAAALSQKADITDVETQQFSQLIQQSIREAKAATLLDPSDVNNWIVMSRIYRSLLGVAEGADSWTVSAYVNAIQTAPSDPQLRIELGGIYYGQGQFIQAAQFFQQATQLKPDLANSYYNLANSLAKAGSLEAAKAAYQQTLVLVEPDSQDYLTATKELEEVQKQLDKAPQNATGSAQTKNQPPSITAQNVEETPLDAITPSDTAVELPPQTPQAQPESNNVLDQTDL